MAKTSLMGVKFFIVSFILIANICKGQGWEVEVMAGASTYNGDLTEKIISPKTIKPAVNLNVKYNIDNTIILRAGVSWLNVEGNDQYNKDRYLKGRNLNFKSTIWEASLCAEINLIEPDLYSLYPYLFAGVGVFRFNPYTYDKDNVKTYLQPLGTEGQGIPDYPKRKPYSLTQLCLPFGGGFKIKLNETYDIIYEMGYRLLFTDYLDDVSTTYVNPQVLLTNNGPKAVELAYRKKTIPESTPPYDGIRRGNPKVKDGYFFTGVKLLIRLGINYPDP